MGKVYEGFNKKDLVTEKTEIKNGSLPKLETAVKTTPAEKATKPTVVAPFVNKKNASHKPKIAMFIDVENVGITRENLLEILFYVNGKYNIEMCKLYGYDEESLPGIKEVADDYNLITVGKMQFRPVGRNCVDARLLIDAYDCAIKNANQLDTIFVWCYPCDLANLFEKITDMGIATATIDNPAFDCKNKYVSQAIKLYSKYNFSMDKTYGGVRARRTATRTTAKKAKTETAATATTPKTETTAAQTPEAASAPASQATKPALETLDGAPIPVLPRREIPERSAKPAAPKAAATPAEPAEQLATILQPGESLADVISRRLHIDKPNLDAHPEDSPLEKFESKRDKQSSLDDVSIFDIMKKVGLIDTENTAAEKKYEDTIGDLWYNVHYEKNLLQRIT